MSELMSAAEAGFAIARSLAAHAVPYALGGALAYGLYGNPRNTNDVDVNVFLNPDELAPAFAAFRALGITVDEAADTSSAKAEGTFMLRYQAMRIDVFTPSIAFSWEAMKTRVAREVDGERIWFLSAEALSVFKMLFFRSKDLVDLERLVAVSGKSMDLAWVRRHVAQMMGERDPRIRAWDEICRQFA